MQNVCLVTTQAFNEQVWTWKHSFSHQLLGGYHVYQDVWKPSIREKLVVKGETH